MNIFNKFSILNAQLNKNYTTGLIPTMGALHKGHTSLIEKALKENGQVIVSIFVNPTQFNNFEDLKKYPRTFDKDIKLIKDISTKINVYSPKPKDLYNNKIQASIYKFDGLDSVMEGIYRPNHFQGVATIVERLLWAFLPNNAYFGEKDFQQIQIIKSLVGQKKIPTKIISCPIIREKNGLAYSSRNTFLTKEQRNTCSLIFEQLNLAKKLLRNNSPEQIMKTIEKNFKKISNLDLEYFDIRDEKNLSIVNKKTNKKIRAFIAAKIGKIRLIDNLSLY
ncbi:MAG: pantoate--beta-alanine ligase [Flavobacteriaceae bacterium]|nr:pantoate--beta-alanine ligase [Flavobacteriaceae bacterium]|tara:strand:- start:7670 stop:8503 length:834 start_codon:yes stop_codon:yes gene_type:complete